VEWEHTYRFPPKRQPQTCGFVTKKPLHLHPGWCNTPSERCEGITKLVFFHQTSGFTSLHGPRFQLYQKEWGVFLLLKNFGDLVAQLGLKTTCFCGTCFSHIKLLEL